MQMGIFVNVQEFRNLSNVERLGHPHPLPDGHAEDLFDVDWWIPTTNFTNATVHLNMGDIWSFLQVRVCHVYRFKQCLSELVQQHSLQQSTRRMFKIAFCYCELDSMPCQHSKHFSCTNRSSCNTIKAHIG